MSTFRLSLCALAVTGLLAAIGAEPSTEEVAARRVAMELAGAWSNDGFKLRDGSWTGRLEPGKSQVVQVNLYAGNEYWFSLGTTEGAEKVAVSIFDEEGTPVQYEPYAEAATAAAGFAPASSGPYLIKVEALKGGPSSFCLLYSYK